MIKEKQIQIPKKFIVDVFKLISMLDSDLMNQEQINLCKTIEEQIAHKLEAMERRELYTKSKNGINEEERESSRKQYVEKAGVHKDWRY